MASSMQDITAAMNAFTERANHFLLTQWTQIRRADESAAEHFMEAAEMADRRVPFEAQEEALRIITNKDLDLENRQDRSNIRAAIANLYGDVDTPAFMRRGIEGDALREFLHAPENLQGAKALYYRAGGDVKEFDNLGFQPKKDSLIGLQEVKSPTSSRSGPRKVAELDPSRRRMLRFMLAGTAAVAAAGTTGGVIAYKHHKSPAFPIGAETVAMEAGKSVLTDTQKEWVAKVQNATSDTVGKAALDDIEKMLPDERGAIIGKLYLDSMASNDFELAKKLARTATFKDLQYEYHRGASNSFPTKYFPYSKNFVELTNKSFSNDNSGYQIAAARPTWTGELIDIVNEAAHQRAQQAKK